MSPGQIQKESSGLGTLAGYNNLYREMQKDSAFKPRRFDERQYWDSTGYRLEARSFSMADLKAYDARALTALSGAAKKKD